jgi:hypothetical protein
MNHNSAVNLPDFELPINQAEEEGEEDYELPEKLAPMLDQEKRMIQPHQ